MADVRCPMCSKSNPEGAEVCAFCQARLKPLIIDQPSEDALEAPRIEPEPEVSPDAEEGEDWLARIRADAETETEETGKEDVDLGEDSPDWLGRLRYVEVDRDEGPPEGEVPEWVSEAGTGELAAEEPLEEAEEVPQWLSRIREREAEEALPQEEIPEAEGDEWLSRLRDTGEAEFEDEELAATASEYPEEQILEFETPEISAEEIEPSDLDSPRLSAFEPEEEAISAEDQVWPDTPEAEVVPSELEEEFEWPQPEPAPSVQPFDRDISEPAVPESFPLEEALEPDETPYELQPEEEPPIFEEPAAPEELDVPSTPALIFDQDKKAPIPKATDSFDDIDLPDWLVEMREAPAPLPTAEEIGDEELAPATLPSWLEAMRPIETFRSVVEIESAADQVVESAGPLAGLRGVLMAEPIVAMPRSATGGVASLEVTERQYAQTQLLQRMLEDEERERPVAPSRRAPMPILRWIVSLVIVLSVALPSIFSSTFSGTFPLPSLVPSDLGPFYAVVESLPVEVPALVVFDYTPGYSGELSAIAGAFLEHLIGRGVAVAMVSTTPTGPPLAEALLNQYGENGKDYINLGYLSGGPTAVQVFAVAPREAIPRGFLLPPEWEIQSGWQSDLLRGVNRLSDFGMVAVITAGTDSARTWAEQSRASMGDTPLVMVLSAGAEPLVRPYYEATQPLVNGILTGMPAAVAYEQQIDGTAQGARSKWDSFGMGMLAVMLLLVGGGVYGVGAGIYRYGVKRAKGEEE